MLKNYYRLSKPGIIYGNLLTAIAGFLFGSHWHFHWTLLVALIFGTALVIASACAINNYLDRGIDAKMARTKKRALVTGKISGKNALTYAAVVGLAGFVILGIGTNFLTLLIGAVAFIFYVAIYGISKRRSSLGTLIGSVAGAAPITAGYCAATNRFDMAAVILFFILVFWQMPHFYAIAIYRYGDYKAAGLPVLPVSTTTHRTKVQIVGYVVAFILACVALRVFGYCGYSFLTVMLLTGLFWLYKGWRGLRDDSSDAAVWARQMFLLSLNVILITSVMLALGPVLP